MSRLLALLLLLIAIPVFAAPQDSPQSLLRELYRVHAQGEGPLLDPQGKAQREAFFTPELVAALESEVNRKDPEEIGKLSFDPFYNAQETDLGEMDIAVPKMRGLAVNAIVRFANSGSPIEIVYRLLQDPHGWRIDDIAYGEGNTLRKTLSGE